MVCTPSVTVRILVFGGQGREGRREEGREAEIWKEEKREKGGREEGEKEGGREGRRERKEETLHTCPTVLQSMTARDFPLTFAYLLAASEPHGRVIEG